MVTAPKAPAKAKDEEVKDEKTIPEQPNPQATQKNTPEVKLPTNKDVGERSNAAALMAVSRTGQLVEDVPALVAETVDQLEAETRRERSIGEKLDTLTMEQLDHQRTLAKALGLGAEQNNEDLMKEAVARADRLKGKERDTSNDAHHESIPANWAVNVVDRNTIHAVNIVTGRVYEGPAGDLMKSAAEEE